VLLALIVDHERLRGIQIAGLALAAVGMVLVST
jgi:drug/metabolite transporter (DMT)-like permease